MVAYRRNFIPSGAYFFTVVLKDRRSTLLVEHIDLLRQAFRRAREQQPFSVVAVVVLPENLHAVLTLPAHDADFPSRWRRIKALFTRSLVTSGMPVERNARGEYSLWQRRFWEHTIRDEADLQQHVDYIHFNPVKHGIVEEANAWPYSSFHRYVRLGWLPADLGGVPEMFHGEIMVSVGEGLRLLRFAAAAALCFLLIGCAAEVRRYPATLTPLESTSGAERKLVKQDTRVSFNSGYERVIRKDTAWKLVGSIPQGKVYASVDSVFSVEGAHVHEAYLVTTRGNLVGFYLPVERSFASLESASVVNIWEEQ